MILRTIESEGLGHLSYFLADERAGVACVVDPRRDVDAYMALAKTHGVRISHIFETHAHEDFISGSRELAARTDAPVYTGPTTQIHVDHRMLTDGDVVHIGALTLRAVHTPGHTPEHVCYVVSGGRGAQAPWGVFTGDALFAGDVGRPDLLGDGTEEDCARDLYRSIFQKLLPLGDELEVLPTHGAGSPCGGDIGDRASSTLGYERRHNPKLQAVNEDDFVDKELASLDPAPLYFPLVRERNVAGPNVLSCTPDVPLLAPRVFEKEREIDDTLVLDTRPIEAFGGAHIRGALNISLHHGAFPVWVGRMVRPHQRLLLVLEDERDLARVQRQLLRTGFENLVGFLGGGMPAWFTAGLPFDDIPQMSVQELKEQLVDNDTDHGLQIVDVRSDGEWRSGHIPRARHVYAPLIAHHADEFQRTHPILTYCSTGFRASMAASVLKRIGFTKVYTVPGSFSAWQAAAYPTERPQAEERRRRA